MTAYDNITGHSGGDGGGLEATQELARLFSPSSSLEALASRYGSNVLPLALDVTDRAAVEKAVKPDRWPE